MFASFPQVRLPNPGSWEQSTCLFSSTFLSFLMNRQSSLTMGHLESVSDLTTLNTPSDDVIVNCLRERFMSDNIYTGVSTSALVVVNPHKYVSSNADSVLHNYAAEYRDTTPGRIPLPPHIFQLANNAYYHMRRTGQDQSMLFRCVHRGCTPR